MRKFVAVAVVVILITAGIFVALALRHAAPASKSEVSVLLPSDTVAVFHLPDFNRLRDQWHDSDLYKLYREPAVQEFLRKPLTQTSKAASASEALHEVEQLGLKDGFVALTSVETKHLLIAGFRFRGSQTEAEKIVAKWRPSTAGPSSTSESYQQHKVQITGEGANLFATAYDKDWFFASNDLDQLKAILDRVDHRGGSASTKATLQQDPTFRAAMAHMPSNYQAMLYLRPKKFAAVTAQFAPTSANQQPLLEQIQSVSGAMRFDGGKIRDVWFVAMPQQDRTGKLKRSAAALGTADTVFYLASEMNLTNVNVLSQIGAATPLTAWLRKTVDAASRQGITAADWQEAFDLELGALADWPSSAHWPSVIATLPVKDRARAKKIVEVLPYAIDEDGAWTKTEKNGVEYFVTRTPATWFSIAPTIALSDKLLVIGIDTASVEAAVTRAETAGAGLARSRSYTAAESIVPEPTTSFVYVDVPLLYTRLDASLRPMLLMAAMFMPAVSGNIDLNKFPPPDVITRHLSPVVASQRYDRDGYVAESVGPMTLSELTVSIGVPTLFWLGRSRFSH